MGRRTQTAAQLVQKLGDEPRLVFINRYNAGVVLVVGVRVRVADDEEVARYLCGAS